ncbi:MAG: NAD-dependent epimerase/dehydratase family protein [Alphaproteobacteria bacterium]|nr:NAD-dependent epimerase/dehydratase family protein [Alphaproteobacteria bacterium]MBU0876508.1 NAD-dependent epimerase/dehydratase family protein [Alphaproteobacteria bacterium]MBU1770979.1 NAD-dependent epimerase/dehydratase family protein [Alphaproteobacteria bacterium]
MSARTALLIGGGGPTGPLVVNALLAEGYEVSVLNTGRHPVDYAGPVERIIADPHYLDPLKDVMRGRHFEVAIAQYGRLRFVAEALSGHVEHLIAIGGMFYPGWIDPAATVRPTSETGEARDWTVHYLNEGAPMPEHVPLDPVGKFGERVVETDTLLRWAHLHGAFDATILRYPRVYGPRQPGAAEWSIIRRILDGRSRIIVPEGGFLLQSVLYVENAARIVMAAVRNRSQAAGHAFNCADREPLTHRKWVEQIAKAMGREVGFASVPAAMARPAWPYARFPLTTGHHVLDLAKMNERLPHDQVPVVPAIQRTVDWYLEDPEMRGRAVEPQLRDSFAYEAEDAILAAMDKLLLEIDALELPDPDMAHPYSHPKAENDRHDAPEGTGR